MEPIFQRQPDMMFSRIDDEVVMMSVETGEYFGLNPVASRIWELLEQPHSFNQLLELLVQEFEVDEPTCRKDVQAFLNQMTEKKLVFQHSV